MKFSADDVYVFVFYGIVLAILSVFVWIAKDPEKRWALIKAKLRLDD